MMESKKITIELSREDAKMIATLLGSDAPSKTARSARELPTAY